MKAAVDFLQAVVRHLSKQRLYGREHASARDALEEVMEALRHLQVEAASVSLSFMSGKVLINDAPVHQLDGWRWGYRLAEEGIERIEIAPGVEKAEMDRFLQILYRRLMEDEEGDAEPGGEDEASRTEALPNITFGRLKLRGQEAEGPEDRGGPTGRVKLDTEASTVGWVHERAEATGRVPVLDTLATVESLARAMHGAETLVTPFLQLKENTQYTAAHCINVSILAMSLAEAMGFTADTVRGLGAAGLLHDLGKVRVPTEVLEKPGKLNDEEWELIRRHPSDGAEMLLGSGAELELSAVVAYEHHMNLDGTGYPDRAIQRDPAPESRLVQVCDIYDAVRTKRAYKSPLPADQVVEILEEQKGTKLDPEFVDPFVELIRRWDPSELLQESRPGPEEVEVSGGEEAEEEPGPEGLEAVADQY